GSPPSTTTAPSCRTYPESLSGARSVASPGVGERFDAVLFDAGGVLVLPDPTVLAPLLAPYGGSVEVSAHRRAHYAAMAVKSMVGAGETDWHEYNVAYVEAVGVDAHMVEHAAVVLHHTRT